MRQFLAMAFLGATLAFGASAALASDQVDYRPPYKPMQTVSTVSSTATLTESDHSMVAGGNTTATDVFRQLRDDNRER